MPMVSSSSVGIAHLLEVSLDGLLGGGDVHVAHEQLPHDLVLRVPGLPARALGGGRVGGTSRDIVKRQLREISTNTLKYKF